ncbi:MAG: hypothetical protein ACI9T7_001215 [Oleiphilaceae bacterium]|jgi:hypothetical protein
MQLVQYLSLLPCIHFAFNNSTEAKVHVTAIRQ